MVIEKDISIALDEGRGRHSLKEIRLAIGKINEVTSVTTAMFYVTECAGRHP